MNNPNNAIRGRHLDSLAAAISGELSDKVDKVADKQLSTEDFTSAYKNQLDGLNFKGVLPYVADYMGNGAMPRNPSTGDFYLVTTPHSYHWEQIQSIGEINVYEITLLAGDFVFWNSSAWIANHVFTNDYKSRLDGLSSALAQKVDKVQGKQLSTEDFTTAEKTKLAGLENFSLVVGAGLSMAGNTLSIADSIIDFFEPVPEFSTRYAQAPFDTANVVNLDLAHLVDGYNFELDTENLTDGQVTRIRSGNASYHVYDGISRGYVEVKTLCECTLTVKYSIGSASGDCGGCIITEDAPNTTFTRSDLIAANFIKSPSGGVYSNRTATYSLAANKTFYLNFGYAKNAAHDQYDDRFFIHEIRVVPTVEADNFTFEYYLPTATTTKAGLMTAADKTKLNGIAANANNYSLPTASTSMKGGIIVGAGLSMAGNTLSVNLNVASSSSAGLMSAQDKASLDVLFRDTSDVVDTVLAGVGSQFIPAASNVTDFLARDDQIQFFDNRLQKIIAGTNYFVQYPSLASFQNGEFTVYIETNGYKSSLVGDAGQFVTLASGNSTLDYGYFIAKLSETAGYIWQEQTMYSNADHAKEKDGKIDLIPFTVNSTGKPSLGSSQSLAAATSSWWADYYGCDIKSIFDPNHVMIYLTDDDKKWYGALSFDGNSAANISRTKAQTSLPSDANTSYQYYKPKISLANGQISVSASNYQYLPLLYVDASTPYVLVHHGSGRQPPIAIAIGDDGWLEDDNNLIAGIWRTRDGTNCYAITFQKGSYNYSAAIWDNITTVWTFDFLSPRLIKTSLKLSDVIGLLEL